MESFDGNQHPRRPIEAIEEGLPDELDLSQGPSSDERSSAEQSSGRRRAGSQFLLDKLGSVRRELQVPLYRNAYALMLNTIIGSVLGAVYWVLAARHYTPAEVGRDVALVSMMLLISVLTQLNFSQALMRFLPRAGIHSRRLLLWAYGISAALAALAASATLAIAHFTLDPGEPLYTSMSFAVWFVISTVGWSIFNLQDAALTGFRTAIWIPLENGLFGLIKLVLLVAFATTSIGYGIYISWTLPVLAFLLPVNLLIFLRILPRHMRSRADSERPDRPTLVKYMAGDYTGAVMMHLSSTFLPVVVVTLLDKQAGAYFYAAQTVATAIALLSMAITSSLVVEASNDQSRARLYAIAVLRRLAVTTFPLAAIAAIGAPFILSLYGAPYRENATLLLQLLMIAVVPRTIVVLYNTMARLQNRTMRLAVVQFVQAAINIGGTVLFSRSIGLQAIGWAAIASQAIPAVVLAPAVIRWLRPPSQASGSADSDSDKAEVNPRA